MQRSRKFAVYGLGLLLTTGTAGMRAPQAEAPDAARTMAVLASEFREGTSLAEWRKTHLEDAVRPFEFNPEDAHVAADTDWCARASQTVRLADGRAIERSAYFYVPERRANEPLPAQDSDPELINSCTLGHVWIETAEADVETGADMAQRLRIALQERLGAPDSRPEMSFLGSAAWEYKAKWKRGNTVTVSAYDTTIGGHGRKRVLALVTTPVADKYGFNFGLVKGFTDDYTPIRELLRQAERAGLLEQQATDIERFLDSTNPNARGVPQDACGDGAELVSVLTRWMQMVNEWQGERHAAALLIADLTVAASPPCLQSEEEATRTRLKALGASLEYSQLGAAWEYTRNWLREVVREQPAGQVGEMAFLDWMRTGFREGCCCQGESPERVITEGERYLQQKRAPETEARVHFMLGDAYRDIVGLASGAGVEYGDPQTYRPQVPRARRQAIAHYRAGLKLDSRSEEAQQAWRTAWRLIAGLGTGETRYFCVYD